MTNRTDIFLIGGSAGSLKVLLEVLPNIKKNISFPIIIIIHRGSSDSILSDLLNSRTDLTVVEAEEKTILQAGYIYLAPPDYHLLIENDYSISLDASEKLNFSRPSIDITFIAATEIFKENTVAILLSGANSDGVAGLNAIKRNNGTTLAQDPLTAEVDYMPKQAILNNIVDYVLQPKEISTFINQLNVY